MYVGVYCSIRPTFRYRNIIIIIIFNTITTWLRDSVR